MFGDLLGPGEAARAQTQPGWVEWCASPWCDSRLKAPEQRALIYVSQCKGVTKTIRDGDAAAEDNRAPHYLRSHNQFTGKEEPRGC